METLIYVFDLCVFAAVIVYSIRNDRKELGASEIGPFRLKALEDFTCRVLDEQKEDIRR